nr:hypothetical protein [Chloroflexota bacterium]
ETEREQPPAALTPAGGRQGMYAGEQSQINNSPPIIGDHNQVTIGSDAASARQQRACSPPQLG